MKQTLTHVRSFNRPIRLLLLNQLTINVGFYMLMPYLANYLAGDLGLAAWLVGLILGVRNLAFRLTCSVAAALFAVLAILQLRALPARRGQAAAPLTFLGHWRQSLADRRFLVFSMAMMGSYVLNFQVYLGLPMEVRRVTGGTLGVTLLFAVSGLLTVVGQVRVAAWVEARWTPGQAMTRGLALMGAAFVPLVLSTVGDSTAAASAANEPQGLVAAGTALAPVLITTVLLTLATMVVYPFEMATIVELAGQGTVGTYYGLYNTISGFGIAAGNLLTGAALDAGRQAGLPSLPWIGLVALGIACSAAVRVVDRRGYLGLGATSPGEEPMEQTGGRAVQALAR